MNWVHIPADSRKGLPEQWQVRMPCVPDGFVSAAVVRRTPLMGGFGTTSMREWQAVIVGPDGTICSLLIGQATPEQARIEVEHALYQSGWR